jgi:calcium release-activated calcium channel protein 1
VARNSREVEEKSEQLKAISSLAAIIAGFAVIAFLEFQFEFRDPSHFLLPLYGACFAATVRADAHQGLLCCKHVATTSATAGDLVNCYWHRT